MNKNKKLSIIAPCYNGEKYLNRFLKSILDLKYKDVQLIIVNDGSSDNSDSIINSFKNDFDKKGFTLTYISPGYNQGIGGCFNEALKQVEGDYLTWFGVDDYPTPDYANIMIDFLNNNNDFGVVRCDGYIFNDNNEIIGKMADENFDKNNCDVFENAILEKNFQFGYSVLRMDYLDKEIENRIIYPSRQGQNWQLLLPLFYKYKCKFIDEPLYYVYYDSNSVSRSAHNNYSDLVKQNNEYQKILFETISKMNISEEEKNKYLKITEEKYIRRRMIAAINYNNKADARREYFLLKKSGSLTKEDKKRYLHSKHPILYSLYKKKFKR